MTQQKSPQSRAKGKKRFSDGQLKQFELAGGAEAGMPAGDAGGPGEKDQLRRQTPKKDKGR